MAEDSSHPHTFHWESLLDIEEWVQEEDAVILFPRGGGYLAMDLLMSSCAYLSRGEEKWRGEEVESLTRRCEFSLGQVDAPVVRLSGTPLKQTDCWEEGPTRGRGPAGGGTS